MQLLWSYFAVLDIQIISSRHAFLVNILFFNMEGIFGKGENTEYMYRFKWRGKVFKENTEYCEGTEYR